MAAGWKIPLAVQWQAHIMELNMESADTNPVNKNGQQQNSEGEGEGSHRWKLRGTKETRLREASLNFW